MAKKSNEEEVDFFYLNEGERISSNKQKKNNKKTKNSKKNIKKSTNTTGIADNEIIIGVNTKSSSNKTSKKPKKKKSNNTKKKSNTNIKSTTSQKDKHNKKKNDNIKQNKRKRVLSIIIKLILVLVLFIVAIVFLMTSPIFNISEVEVKGNNKITSDTYISLSKITLGNNIYNVSKTSIIRNIKENPYVDSVEINRKLPNKIEITVKERSPSYMLGVLNSYAYINNQGYILEVNEEKLNVPVITGYSTNQEEITPGNRLNSEDLSKLETAIKIMDNISISGITETVSEINILDKNNYTLIFLEEGKIVYLGDGSNLTDRINIYLKAILQKEKGKNGEVFINGDLNKDKVFFREKV